MNHSDERNQPLRAYQIHHSLMDPHPTKPTTPPQHLGWYDRGRLPHFDAAYQYQMITIRLADSLPRRILDQWEQELKFKDKTDADRERRQRTEAYLDTGCGACFLRDPRVAALVQQTLVHFDPVRYELKAWCIMPNHIHVLMKQAASFPLHQVVWSWKSWTAKGANRLLDRSGPFWQREYHDRYIRDAAHLAYATAYIENNPVKAGLVVDPAHWPWSSAHPQNAGCTDPDTTDGKAQPEG